MQSERFEWDDRKAQANFRKHGFSFDEADTVFDSKLALTLEDAEHSSDEPRLILIGSSSQLRVLLLVYTERVVIDQPALQNHQRKKSHIIGKEQL